MRLYVAGGCSEHGRNCFLVQGESISFMVDAGVMKEHPERKWPELTHEMVSGVKYLFFTHSHTDHTGALEWLYELGFRGEVVAAKATVDYVKHKIRNYRLLEELGNALTEISLGDGLVFRWGRSGHCIGSVWYRFELDGRSILFSGDYTENSYAYHCDLIRNETADLAVLDCAYGTEKEDGRDHRRVIERDLDELAERHIPLLFPVPSHGRGLDVLSLLAERGVKVVIGRLLTSEYESYENRWFWLKEEFIQSTVKLRKMDFSEFEGRLEETDRYPAEYADAAVIVRDSQLYDQIDQNYAVRIYEAGGLTFLTGKQDPSSFSRKLLDEGKAVFDRISVHQNCGEMKKLALENHFSLVIPYHCRQQLKFDEDWIKVLSPAEAVEI